MTKETEWNLPSKKYSSNTYKPVPGLEQDEKELSRRWKLESFFSNKKWSIAKKVARILEGGFSDSIARRGQIHVSSNGVAANGKAQWIIEVSFEITEGEIPK